MESLESNPQVGANSVNPSFSGSQVILTDPYLNSSPGNPSIGDPIAPSYHTSSAHYIVGGCDPHAVPYASERQNPAANAEHHIVGGSDPHEVPYASEQQNLSANAGHHNVGDSGPHAVPYYASEQQNPPTSAGHYILGSSDPHAIPYTFEQQYPPADAGHHITGGSDSHAVPYASEERHLPTNTGHYITSGFDPHAVPYISEQQNPPTNAGYYILGSSDPHTISYDFEQQYSPANAGHHIVGGSDLHTIPYAFEQRHSPANAGHYIVGDSDPYAIFYAFEQQYPPANAGRYIMGGPDPHSPASAGHYIVGGSEPHTVPYASEQQHAQANAGQSVVGSSNLHAIDDGDWSGLLDPHNSSTSPSISSHRAVAVRTSSWTPNDAPVYGITGQNLIPFLSSGSEEGLPISLSDVLLYNFRKFLESILERSNMESDPLFVLMETFIIDYGGEYKVMGCLAVTTANEDNTLRHGYVLSSVSQSETEPKSWLTTQSLGSLFESERQKRGVWALTQLPDGHLKSLTQQWTFLKLR
jgi:hypothetical protein